MHASFSSHDVHELVRLVDDDGRVLERRFTGYEASGSQDAWIPLVLATAALHDLTAIAPAPRALDAADVELFADRFVAAVPHFDDSSDWWVMERFVDLARYLGSPATIAGLLTRLRVAKLDRSSRDARRGAVAALAAITGGDARADVADVDAAAARYLAACRISRP
jgi:hypothetical protein